MGKKEKERENANEKASWWMNGWMIDERWMVQRIQILSASKHHGPYTRDIIPAANICQRYMPLQFTCFCRGVISQYTMTSSFPINCSFNTSPLSLPNRYLSLIFRNSRVRSLPRATTVSLAEHCWDFLMGTTK